MNKFRNVNRVIFDLDNTIIKHNFSKENECTAKHFGVAGNYEFMMQFDNMFKNNGKYLKGKLVTKEYFVYIMEMLMPILKVIGKTGYDLLDTIDMYHAGTLMEGSKEILEYLSEKGYQIVAFTNWFGDYQSNILKKLGIHGYFERMYSWDDYYAKPNHHAMIRALGGTNPKQNVMIGDDLEGDVILPKSCSVKTIGFNISYKDDKTCIRADEDITKLIEIKNYL